MSKIRLASTVILLREIKQKNSSQLQAYTIKRPETMKFLPGFTVFPGGALEESDLNKDWQEYILHDIGKYPLLSEDQIKPPSSPFDLERSQDMEIAFVVAAIREVFEETGALICQPNDKYLTPQYLTPYRRAMEKKELTFFEIIKTLQIKLDSAQIWNIGNRLTPPNKIARFQTNFYITFVPEEIQMIPSLHEVASDAWIEPSRAKEMWEREEILCVPPTKECFRSLEALTYQELQRKLS